MTELKKNYEESQRLYREAEKAWADPTHRLSKNRTIHVTRYVLRNRALKKTMNGKIAEGN